MALLRHLESGRTRPLSPRTLVGRAPPCALRLEQRHVSGEHATLIWNGEGWEVRDLGSRNGTWVDGRRLQPGVPAALQAGNRLAFGATDDAWDLLEGGPPGPLAQSLQGGRLLSGRGGMLVLPSEDRPEAVVYPDPQGQWWLEVGEGERRPMDEELVVTAGGEPWRIWVPTSQEGTASVDGGPTLETIRLQLAVSRDEEHVRVTVQHRDAERVLEVREHWYTMLTLARARLSEAELPVAEQGWLERDALLKMLGMDSNGLNVAIYRARRQLEAAGVLGAAGVVEVRRGQRRIGLEPSQLEVVPWRS